MTNLNNKIHIDFSDLSQLQELMQRFGETESMMPAVNSEGEKQSISFYPDRIVLVTFQSNRWERQNIYWHDGTVEEIFNGRWK